MKVLLAVSVVDGGHGAFTHKTSIDKNFPLISELNIILKTEKHYYEHLGNVDEILLIDNNEVFARWSKVVGWTDKDGNEIQ